MRCWPPPAGTGRPEDAQTVEHLDRRSDGSLAAPRIPREHRDRELTNDAVRVRPHVERERDVMGCGCRDAVPARHLFESLSAPERQVDQVAPQRPLWRRTLARVDEPEESEP